MKWHFQKVLADFEIADMVTFFCFLLLVRIFVGNGIFERVLAEFEFANLVML